MIAVLGSSGYVGSKLVKTLQEKGIDYCTYSVRYPFKDQDIRHFFLSRKVNVIINCQGYTGKPNVDECEKEDKKVTSLFANSLLPYSLAEFCNKYKIRLIHISSGCIYTDSNCDNAKHPIKEFNESDLPNFTWDQGNCSWYSGTKALGEKLLSNDYTSTIVRLRIPFNGDINPRNYIQKIISYPKLLNATNSFSYLDEFIDALILLSEEDRYYPGVLNLTQPGYLTTHSIVNMLKDYGLVQDKEWFESIEEFNQTIIAPRSNCVLDSSAAIRYGIKLTPIEDAMREAISKYLYNKENGKRY